MSIDELKRMYEQAYKDYEDAYYAGFCKKTQGDVMMDAMLKQIGEETSDMIKKLWEKEQMKGINVTEELQDLLSVYMKAEEHLKEQEEIALDNLTSRMKAYIEKQTERKKISEKLITLKRKIVDGVKQEDDEE